MTIKSPNMYRPKTTNFSVITARFDVISISTIVVDLPAMVAPTSVVLSNADIPADNETGDEISPRPESR